MFLCLLLCCQVCCCVARFVVVLLRVFLSVTKLFTPSRRVPLYFFYNLWKKNKKKSFFQSAKSSNCLKRSKEVSKRLQF